MAIEFRPPRPEEFPQLRCLFVEAFGEPEFADSFFQLAYAPERCLVATEGEILGMLHWFDCFQDGKKLAYLYAVAVKPARQGTGIGSRLLRYTLEYLSDYGGILLVPAEESLFSYYEKFGFSVCSSIREISAEAGEPVPVRRLTAAEFGELRRDYLPSKGIRQEGEALELLASYAHFYASPHALAAVSGGNVLEFLGDEQELPGLLAALGLGRAEVRMPGESRPFAMGRGAEENLYFGLALD